MPTSRRFRAPLRRRRIRWRDSRRQCRTSIRPAAWPSSKPPRTWANWTVPTASSYSPRRPFPPPRPTARSRPWPPIFACVSCSW
jgi:hypothetical protein